MKSISVEDLKTKLASLSSNELIIDVRSKDEFDSLRIDSEKIINIDVNEIVHKSEEFKDKTLYLICNSGSRSGMAQIILSSKGVSVINVDGGIQAWLYKNFPTIT